MVPQGNDINSYLEELVGRWNKVIDKNARQNLLTDVNTLIRDRMRQILHYQKHIRLSESSMTQIALKIIEENATLKKLNNQNYMQQYAVIYMIKLLGQLKS
jgi:hypothetical protein